MAVLETIADSNATPTAPTLTLYDSENFGLELDEGTTIVQTFTATDNDTLTYTLEGVDTSAFNISSSGALTFKVAPDYESPIDVGGDNVYDVTVKVSDGTLSDTQSVSIHIKDVNEGAAIPGFDAAAMIAAGKANFFTIYESGKEFEHINIPTTGSTGSWSDYLYENNYFNANGNGTFTWAPNGSNSITITPADEGGKVETLTFTNAQTALTSGGTDISAFRLNQVTATFTVTTESNLNATQDWEKNEYLMGNLYNTSDDGDPWWLDFHRADASEVNVITDYSSLGALAVMLLTDDTTQITTQPRNFAIFINEDYAVVLDGTGSEHLSSGSLNRVVWDGTYVNETAGWKTYVLAGSVEGGSWTIDTTSYNEDMLIVNVEGVGKVAYRMDANGDIFETQLDAVGTTRTETLYYSDTANTASFADALGNSIDSVNYAGLSLPSSDGYYFIATTDANGIMLEVDALSANFADVLSSDVGETVYKITAEDQTAETITLTAADVLRLSSTNSLIIDIDDNDNLNANLAGWTEGSTDGNGYITYTLDTATLYVHIEPVIA